jgi:hypothetical protein
MNKHLRTYVRQQRELKGIRLGDLAEKLGYNRSKGANRILAFEREGHVTDDLLRKLIQALELDEEMIIAPMERDRADWEAWVNEPVPMQMIVRLMAAVYSPHQLPAHVTTEQEAETYARAYAKEKGRRVCLALNRRESVWIGCDGHIEGRTQAQPGIPNIPYASLGGRRKFLLDISKGGMTPVVLKEF